MPERTDVIIAGGGPAGATLGALLAMAGRPTMILERAPHPRDHVGELLLPSVNMILHRIGLLGEMNDRGFAQRDGLAWTHHGRSGALYVRTADFPPPRALLPYGFNVDRAAFDCMLLRRAESLGAQVLEGVSARRVLFDRGRAVGVRVQHADGSSADVMARFVVDASGRRALLGSQLGL